MLNQKPIILFSLLLCFACSAFSKSISYPKDSIEKLVAEGNYEEALTFMNKIESTIPNDNYKQRYQWLLDYSKVNSLLYSADSSYQSIFKAIDLAKQHDNLNLELKAKSVLLELYRKMQMFDAAFVLVKEERRRLLEASDTIKSYFFHRAAANYNEATYILNDSSLLDTAISLSLNSLKYSTKHDLIDDQATSYNELGNLYERKSELDSAEFYYRKAISLRKDKPSTDYANLVINYGNYFLRLQELDSAINYYLVGVRFLSKSDEKRIVMDAYEGLRKAYYSKGDSLKHLRYALLLKETEHILDRKTFMNRIYELDKAMQTEKKDALIRETKIQIQAQEKQERLFIIAISLLVSVLGILLFFYGFVKRKNNTLRTLVKENEFLVGESNHRIKNNLQLIISLIGRELYKGEEGKEGLKEISDKITSIATLHQHLYLSDSKEKIKIKPYLESIIENFGNLNYFKSIRLQKNIQDFELKIDRAVYLGLLITELITNSIKHAFPNKIKTDNTLSINLKRDSNKLEINYKDNGIGLAKGQEPNLVKLLCKQLKAEYEVKSEEGKGFELNLII